MEPLRNGVCGDWRLPDEDFLASFALPGPRDRYEVLAEKHPFPRESRIHFNEATHVYTVDGLTVPRSVTGLLHKYVGEFNAMAAIEAMKRGPQWQFKKEEFERDGLLMSDAEIAATWSKRSEVARARGTLLHFQAESFLNGLEPGRPRVVEEPHSPEYRQFLQIYGSAIKDKMEVYRTEVNLFHCGLRVAGQPDFLARGPDGGLIIWDLF